MTDTNRTRKRKLLTEYLIIILGVTIQSMAINLFYEPNSMVTGGVTGIAIILMELTERIGYPIPLWLTNIVLNIPLFIVGVRLKGKDFIQKSLFATVFLSFALFYTKFIPALPIQSDLTLSSIFGGTLAGAGLGLVFHSMATTGGSDLTATLIHSRHKHISVSSILFVLDFIVISAGLFVFGPVKALYAIIAVFITSRVIDSIQEGFSFAKAAFIISDKADDIASLLISELGRGATSLYGKGMYTGKDRNVLLCVISNKEIVKVKEIVHNQDSKAFVIVTDVREVLGLGFASLG